MLLHVQALCPGFPEPHGHGETREAAHGVVGAAATAVWRIGPRLRRPSRSGASSAAFWCRIWISRRTRRRTSSWGTGEASACRVGLRSHAAQMHVLRAQGGVSGRADQAYRDKARPGNRSWASVQRLQPVSGAQRRANRQELTQYLDISQTRWTCRWAPIWFGNITRTHILPSQVHLWHSTCRQPFQEVVFPKKL